MLLGPQSSLPTLALETHSDPQKHVWRAGQAGAVSSAGGRTSLKRQTLVHGHSAAVRQAQNGSQNLRALQWLRTRRPNLRLRVDKARHFCTSVSPGSDLAAGGAPRWGHHHQQPLTSAQVVTSGLGD